MMLMACIVIQDKQAVGVMGLVGLIFLSFATENNLNNQDIHIDMAYF